MRHFSGSKQENDKGDRMSRARSARDGFAIAGPQWQDLRVSIGPVIPGRGAVQYVTIDVVGPEMLE